VPLSDRLALCALGPLKSSVQSYSQALQRITGGELGKDCVVSAFCAGRLALQWEGDRLKGGIGQGTHKEVAPNLQYWMMMTIVSDHDDRYNDYDNDGDKNGTHYIPPATLGMALATHIPKTAAEQPTSASCPLCIRTYPSSPESTHPHGITQTVRTTADATGVTHILAVSSIGICSCPYGVSSHIGHVPKS